MSTQDTIEYPTVDKAASPKLKGRAQEIDQVIGQKIKEFRKARKLTQNDLANRLNVSPQQIVKYEKGISRISLAQMSEISEITKVPLHAFLSENSAPMGMADSVAQSQIAGYDSTQDDIDINEVNELLSVYYGLGDSQSRSSFVKAIKNMADSFKK